jgi:hypothetical protein
MRGRAGTGGAGVALALGLLLGGTPARAWVAHQLNAQAGSLASDSSTDPDDPLADALAQVGVGGVNDYSYFAHARADSARGLLRADSRIDNGEGATVTSAITIASIEQWLHVDDDGGPVTAQFVLDTGLSSYRMGTAVAEAAARLDVTSLCTLYVELRAGEDPDVIDNCTDDYGSVSYVASGGAGALHVTVTWEAGAVPADIDFLAQVENEVDVSFQATAYAQALATGALSISVTGGTASYTSPSFLTLPEPDGDAIGLLAIAPFAALARRRRTP